MVRPEPEGQRGFRVAEVSWDDLTDLTEQRVFLEGQALRLAIDHSDLAWESRVLAAHHRLASTPMLDLGLRGHPDCASPAVHTRTVVLPALAMRLAG